MSAALRTRDRNRTLSAIVSAARKEFAQKGYAGARMESIARIAGIKKELIYHYFRSKEHIFQEVRIQQSIDAQVRVDATVNPIVDPAGAVEDLFAWRFDVALGDLEWVKLITWEAAQGTDAMVPCEDSRREAIGRSIAAIKQAQDDGRVPLKFDPRLLLLSVFALATYPLAYEQITRMTTGCLPSDTRFQKEWCAFLKQLGGSLMSAATTAEPVAVPAKKPMKRKIKSDT